LHLNGLVGFLECVEDSKRGKVLGVLPHVG